MEKDKDLLAIGYVDIDIVNDEERIGGSATITAINGQNLGRTFASTDQSMLNWINDNKETIC